MSAAGRFLIIVGAAVSLIAIGLLLTGHPVAAVLTLLSPLILVVLVFAFYAVLSFVAFLLGRLDALKRR